MRIIRTRDYGDMSRKAADFIAAQVILKPDAVLGLATGTSPLGAYRILIEWHRKEHLSFRHVTTFNLDEYRGLCPKDPQSCRNYMRQNLLGYIDIPRENTHLPDGLAQDVQAECVRYEAAIRAAGGLDLQLVGIGINGHLGFNEPGKGFISETHPVTLTGSTRRSIARHFDSEEAVPTEGITMGIRTILSARTVLVVASGREKADILKAAFEGPVTPEVPASALQLHQNVVLVADDYALSLLGDCPASQSPI